MATNFFATRPKRDVTGKPTSRTGYVAGPGWSEQLTKAVFSQSDKCFGVKVNPVQSNSDTLALEITSESIRLYALPERDAKSDPIDLGEYVDQRNRVEFIKHIIQAGRNVLGSTISALHANPTNVDLDGGRIIQGNFDYLSLMSDVFSKNELLHELSEFSVPDAVNLFVPNVQPEVIVQEAFFLRDYEPKNLRFASASSRSYALLKEVFHMISLFAASGGKLHRIFVTSRDNLMAEFVKYSRPVRVVLRRPRTSQSQLLSFELGDEGFDFSTLPRAPLRNGRSDELASMSVKHEAHDSDSEYKLDWSKDSRHN